MVSYLESFYPSKHFMVKISVAYFVLIFAKIAFYVQYLKQRKLNIFDKKYVIINPNKQLWPPFESSQINV